jgi:L-ascorbate metabolism protein UlaG (beta-lactamase superfamily)
VSDPLQTTSQPINPLIFLWTRVTALFRFLRLFWKFMVDKPRHTRPQDQIPVDRITREDLEAAPNRTLWRLGHSTVLIKLQDAFWLTDPVFAHRASPIWFAGPKRFHQPPIAIRDLPPLKAIILSHDHYDHLDKRAVQKLARKTDWFIVPRGVGDHLRRWGILADKIREREWYESTEIHTGSGPSSSGVVRFTSTPTQHFSGRSLWNRNQTLFCSWVIDDAGFRIFYGADSGYFPGFRDIGDQYGPFAVTLLENGAYNVRWSTIHMQPEETVRAHQDLRGEWLIPIHNGTFDLALHPWTEPMERIQARVQALAGTQDLRVSTPRFGEPVHLDHITPATAWWRSVDGAQQPIPSTQALEGEKSYQQG